MFPSPIGVLYISILKLVNAEKSSKLFPSPIGVLYISILKPMFDDGDVDRVSVPYWGSLYFNTVLRSPYNYRAAKPDCGAKPNPAFTI